MPRYFIEVSYKGTNYSGFQVQKNANSIQHEIEKAFGIIHRTPVALTGSSRTDAGVHALQNYFHFDYEGQIHSQFIYKMNAILPHDIAIRNLQLMPAEAHCRFDAVSREYIYKIHWIKNPFLQHTSFFFPYKVDIELMQQAASLIPQQRNFFAFAKTNTQVSNFNCIVEYSKLILEEDQLLYHIKANRFLRGMIRLLTGTLLKIGRHKLATEQFQNFFQSQVKCGYSVPAHGLFLTKVNYPDSYFL